MERKRTGKLLAAFVVALVAALGLVLGLDSTARADDTYTIAIINTNTSQAVFETNEGELNKEYTAVLFGPEDPKIDMIWKPDCFEYVKKAGDRSISFKASSEGSDNLVIFHPTGGGGVGGTTTFAVSVTKNTSVKYLDASGKQQTCEEYSTITSETTSQLDGGWWVVRGKVTLDEIRFGDDGNPISGTANLIICDGAELNVTRLYCFGTFVIYAQSTGSDMGKIVADCSASTYGSGIYSKDTLTINGGLIVAKGGAAVSGLSAVSTVTINGGNITCEGDYGISTNDSNVTFNGGTTTLRGTSYVFNPSTSVSIKGGITVLAGASETTATDVTRAGTSTWSHSAKWARLTAPVRATSVELDHTQLTLEIDEQATIVATVKPDDVVNKTATWTSSNEGVVTVDDNGIVTAVSAGNATITATSVDNPEVSAECAVTVKAKPVPVTSVELSPATATLEVGKTAALKATVKPDDAADKSVTWASSNEKVATVKDGVVTAVAEGKATITATSVNNPKATATCAVTVRATPAKGKQMFRLYNPNSGEHFYTANAAERDNVKNAGWTYEGVGWTAPESGSPVYRLYNEFGGEHHYTTSKGEHDSLVAVGWKDEGIGWRTAGTGGVPLYRQYNPNAFANNHNYTTNRGERDMLVGLGWRDEGIAWYGL